MSSKKKTTKSSNGPDVVDMGEDDGAFSLPSVNLELNKAHFEALSYFTQKDGEDFKKGICFIVEEFSVKMLATTGAMLAMINVPQSEMCTPCRFWIDATAVSGLEPHTKDGLLTLEKIADEPGLFSLPRVSVIGKNGSIVASANELTPNFNGVLPKGPRQSMNHMLLHPQLLESFVKAAKKLKAEGIRGMQHIGGGNAITVRFERVPHFYGVVMPIEGEPFEEDRPPWL